jgi:hypothetical protein
MLYNNHISRGWRLQNWLSVPEGLLFNNSPAPSDDISWTQRIEGWDRVAAENRASSPLLFRLRHSLAGPNKPLYFIPLGVNHTASLKKLFDTVVSGWGTYYLKSFCSQLCLGEGQPIQEAVLQTVFTWGLGGLSTKLPSWRGTWSSSPSSSRM